MSIGINYDFDGLLDESGNQRPVLVEGDTFRAYVSTTVPLSGGAVVEAKLVNYKIGGSDSWDFAVSSFTQSGSGSNITYEFSLTLTAAKTTAIADTVCVWKNNVGDAGQYAVRATLADGDVLTFAKGRVKILNSAISQIEDEQ